MSFNSKIKTPEQYHSRCSDVFVADLTNFTHGFYAYFTYFTHIPHIDASLLTLNK